MPLSLVILAAGASQRFGGTKQTTFFGPAEETIQDYSIYDAIKAGFDDIIFIIQEKYQAFFKESMQKKWADKVSLRFCIQDNTTKVHDKNSSFQSRTKPWGTGHALLCLEGFVSNPFAIINADDFYGRKSFQKAYEFLTTGIKENIYGNVFYTLHKTMSNHGEVTRGVCEIDNNSMLKNLTEYLHSK